VQPASISIFVFLPKGTPTLWEEALADRPPVGAVAPGGVRWSHSNDMQTSWGALEALQVWLQPA